MDYKALIAKFCSAPAEAMSVMVNTPISPGKPTFENKITSPENSIAAMVGLISGKTNGAIILSMDEKTAFDFVEGMLQEQHSEVNDDVKDCVCEFTNVIFGSLKPHFNELGFFFEMSIPSIIEGSPKFFIPTQEKAMTIPLTTDSGRQCFVTIILGHTAAPFLAEEHSQS